MNRHVLRAPCGPQGSSLAATHAALASWNLRPMSYTSGVGLFLTGSRMLCLDGGLGGPPCCLTAMVRAPCTDKAAVSQRAGWMHYNFSQSRASRSTHTHWLATDHVH